MWPSFGYSMALLTLCAYPWPVLRGTNYFSYSLQSTDDVREPQVFEKLHAQDQDGSMQGLYSTST